jgi:predicted ester cyclase
MKKIFLLLLGVGFIVFTACNEKVKVAAATDKDSTDKMERTSETKSKQNKQIGLASMEAFNKHDVDAGFKDCAPNFLDYGDGSGKPMDLESVKQFFKGYLNAVPDFKNENIRCVADDEWAMVWADCSGTWKNDFMNQKANGKGFKIRDVDLFRFNEEGKIIEHYNVQPFSAIAKQIGLKM